MRSLLALVLVALQFSWALPTAALAAFNDVSSSTAEKEAIESLRSRGVLEGYEDGTFRPDAVINRAEFVKIIIASMKRDAYEPESGCFPDVQKQWFAPFVCKAKEEGIIAGYPDGSFKPDQTISFVEAAKILSLAYEQDGESDSNEWYEPYARALESANAIPVSIKNLSKLITRGEMAEMMWRLSENVTDRPSTGYLNLKYPTVSVDLSSDEPQLAKRCEDLAAFGQSGASNGYDGEMLMKEMANPTSDTAGAPARSQSGGGSDHSTTNVQVQGVDEADIVKTDGTHIYTLSPGLQKLTIVRAESSGDLAKTAEISFAGGPFSPQDMYVEGKRLVVIGHSWNPQPMIMEKRMMIYPPMWNPGRTTARIYDISNPAKPVAARTVSFDGSLISSRRIDDKLYMVVNQGMRYWGGVMPLARDAQESDILPTFSDSAVGDDSMPVTRCGNVTILPHVPSPQYLTVGVVDIDSDKAEVQRTVILGRGDTVYSSEDNLYVAVQDWNYRWDAQKGDTASQQTRVFRFALENNGAAFEAKGSVPGRLLNQFSMDEHKGTFRVATTTDGYFDSSDRENNLFVLNKDTLDVAGSITGIAPGEQIYSVRFLGDRAYMVTFKTVDPLFVIDTSNPRSPKVLGELKIPGYSSYLHPLDENHLIGFGKEVDESIDSDLVHDPNAVYYTAVQGLKLALFDVTDVKNPKEIAKEVIGDRGSESPLLYDHRALFYDAERGILAFPASVMKVEANPTPSGPWDKEVQKQVFQGAYVFSVDAEDGFDLLGKATHYKEGDCDRSTPWTYCYGRDVARILRIGSTLFTVSDGGVQSHSLPRMTTLSELRFENANEPKILY